MIALDSSICNDVKLFSPLFIGIGTAKLIDYVAHSYLQCEKESNVSMAIMFTSIVVGVGVGVYARGFFPVHVFSALEKISLIALPILLITSGQLSEFPLLAFSFALGKLALFTVVSTAGRLTSSIFNS